MSKNGINSRQNVDKLAKIFKVNYLSIHVIQ